MEDRVYTRQKYLKGAAFKRISGQVTSILDAAGVGYCLVGGLAVAYHANPPVTVDMDLLVSMHRGSTEERAVLGAFMDLGWRAYQLFFGRRQKGIPVAGSSIEKDDPASVADLIYAGRDTFLLSAIERAKRWELQPGVTMPVITPEDLFVMKVLSGRDKDISDVRELQRVVQNLDMEYVERVLDGLA